MTKLCSRWGYKRAETAFLKTHFRSGSLFELFLNFLTWKFTFLGSTDGFGIRILIEQDEKVRGTQPGYMRFQIFHYNNFYMRICVHIFSGYTDKPPFWISIHWFFSNWRKNFLSFLKELCHFIIVLISTLRLWFTESTYTDKMSHKMLKNV